MPQITKKDKIKNQKDRIADSAVRMFIKNGYEKTSLNDIIAKLGIAKGTFYHYFSSKEEMLDYLIKEMCEDILPEVAKIVENREFDALTKINKAVRKIKRYKVARRRIVKLIAVEIYKEENLVLRHKITEQSTKLYLPLFTKIIEQGKKEKIFKVDNPGETAEIFMRLSIAFGEIVAPVIFNQKLSLKNINIFRNKVKAFKEAMGRILGMKQGDLDIYDVPTLKKIME